MPKCIVSTRKDGVTVTHPTPEIMSILTCGGAPKGYFGPELTIDGQIASMAARGIRESVAHKYIKHLFCGGLTDAEAYELIRDRDTDPEWTAKELWEPCDLPGRWFRDAWSRSHNGGPITIDLNKARPIQFRRIKSAVERENKKRADDLHSFDALLDVDFLDVRKRISAARDEQELRLIWI